MTTVRLLVAAATIATAVLAPPPSARAQICGDADDSGSITVTDGVNVLRAAAALGACEPTRCDVDGNGSVTVTDGVNVLRAAAGLGNPTGCTQRRLARPAAHVPPRSHQSGRAPELSRAHRGGGRPAGGDRGRRDRARRGAARDRAGGVAHDPAGLEADRGVPARAVGVPTHERADRLAERQHRPDRRRDPGLERALVGLPRHARRAEGRLPGDRGTSSSIRRRRRRRRHPSPRDRERAAPRATCSRSRSTCASGPRSSRDAWESTGGGFRRRLRDSGHRRQRLLDAEGSLRRGREPHDLHRRDGRGGAARHAARREGRRPPARSGRVTAERRHARWDRRQISKASPTSIAARTSADRRPASAPRWRRSAPRSMRTCGSSSTRRSRPSQAVPEPFADAVVNHRDEALAAYDAVQELRRALTLDVASTLGVKLTFGGNDGD